VCLINNKSKATVSVLLCTYNDIYTLESAVNSVLAQTYGDFEFVIVNDASTDATQDVLDKFAKKDSRIAVYLNSENIGLTSSLNRGLSHCGCEYVARIDADDLWHKDKLQRQMGYIKEHPECALLGTAYEEIDASGLRIGAATVSLFTDNEQLKNAMVKFNPFFHSSVIVKRSLLVFLNGYNEAFRYAQDYNLWVRIAENNTVANLPEILAYRRITADNISVKKERLQRVSALKSKILAIKLLGGGSLQYKYLLGDFAVIISPASLVSLARSFKRKIT